ncbi:unnamed protein product [Darwinula stevensoni]|uniref:Uncharacterized protein n=1 Tax=Darwinula stevensoni TaxID=69355 RepID=A0A7R9AF60_9CRUS|nr:unnamed protein product [Darwinula stevensoni]CAG0902979.1 unnamed protein product [Darwinula stevensoni]
MGVEMKEGEEIGSEDFTGGTGETTATIGPVTALEGMDGVVGGEVVEATGLGMATTVIKEEEEEFQIRVKRLRTMAILEAEVARMEAEESTSAEEEATLEVAATPGTMWVVGTGVVEDRNSKEAHHPLRHPHRRPRLKRATSRGR